MTEQLIQSGQYGYRITLWSFIQEKPVYVRGPDCTVLKNRQLWYSSWLNETLVSTKPRISVLIKPFSLLVSALAHQPAMPGLPEKGKSGY